MSPRLPFSQSGLPKRAPATQTCRPSASKVAVIRPRRTSTEHHAGVAVRGAAATWTQTLIRSGWLPACEAAVAAHRCVKRGARRLFGHNRPRQQVPARDCPRGVLGQDVHAVGQRLRPDQRRLACARQDGQSPRDHWHTQTRATSDGESGCVQLGRDFVDLHGPLVGGGGPVPAPHCRLGRRCRVHGAPIKGHSQLGKAVSRVN